MAYHLLCTHVNILLLGQWLPCLPKSTRLYPHVLKAALQLIMYHCAGGV